MQQVTIQPPATPGGPVIVTQTQVTPGAPQTHAEYRGLLMLRSELREQANAAAGRRNSLSEQLQGADPGAREAIRARMKEQDLRLVRLDAEIDRTNDLIASAPAHVLEATTTVDPEQMLADRLSKDLVPIVGILSVFVFLPFTIAISRFIWRRASAPPRAAVADHAAQQRLEQIQQSIDAIAIEVERISEGQRFVSKMLSDRNSHAIGAGAADPLRASMKAAIPSERG